MQKLRVLLIDSSIFASEKIAQGLLMRLPGGTLLEKCLSAIDAENKVAFFHPDVIVMNFAVASFTIDGNPFLPVLVRRTGVPVVTYGLLAESRTTALALGAKEYVVKPEDSGDADFLSHLTATVCYVTKDKDPVLPPLFMEPGDLLTRDRWKAANQKMATDDAEAPLPPLPAKYRRATGPALIAIGSSTGGPDALTRVLHKLVLPMPPILIVQHIPATFSALFAKRLDRECPLHIKEAENGEEVAADTVFIAPGGKHMTVALTGGSLLLTCEEGPRVHNVCPSADVLFHSVAGTLGPAAAGVILTGMGRDGAAGLLEMRRRGSHTFGQDEATCVVYGMPRAAYELGAVEKQLPLEAIPVALTRMVKGV